jgi:hypothetical protein
LLEETWMYPSLAFSNIILGSFNVRVYFVVFVCIDRIPLQIGLGGILWER